MKKVLPLIIALLILCIFTVVFSIHDDNSIVAQKDSYIYQNNDTRNFCIEALQQLMAEDNILVLGSSELVVTDEVAYPPALFGKGKSDYNMILLGRGNTQALHHAISLAALSDKIEDSKVVLILSPQWFTSNHISNVVYASRFMEPLFAQMVKNNRLSYETKRKLTDRVESYLKTGDPDEYKRVLLYDKVYVEKNANIPEFVQTLAWDGIAKNKYKTDFLQAIQGSDGSMKTESIVAKEIDYSELLSRAEQAGIEACTNNDLYIYDDYYTTYIEPNYSSRKDSEVKSSYLTSQEYDDFELFLKVCEETNIHPLIVNIPVNGIWYDWTGFPLNDRNEYYQRIRDICREHNVSILDFSDKEYEHYFLKDIMHLGWKGWVYLDEAVYRYHLSPDETIEYPFELSAHLREEGNYSTISLDSHISDVEEAWLQTESGIISLVEKNNGYLSADIDTELPKEFELYSKGHYGAGIHADLRINMSKKLFQDEIDLTSGVSVDDEGIYTMSTDVEGNRFSFIEIQLYDAQKKWICNLQKSKMLGDVSGSYQNDLPDGEYIIAIKANSNKADESIMGKVNMKTGDTISWNYCFDTITETKIQISNVEFWLDLCEEYK